MEKYKEIIESYLEGTSFTLIDLKQKVDSRNIMFEVFIDKKEKFGIDEIADVNRNLRKIFEEQGIDREISKFVVSSPGAESSFKYFWQMEKHIGRELEMKNRNGDSITGKFESILDPVKEEFQISVKEKKEVKFINYLFGDMAEIKIKLSFKK